MTELKAEPLEPAGGKPRTVRRHVLLRLFGIKFFGWIKLILLCILVGFVVLVVEYDPATKDVDVGQAFGRFLSSAWVALRWAVLNFWKPALAGAGIVMPIWVLWRFLSLPFRK